MANQKITDLTATTAPAPEDLLVMVDDPAGTPATQKVTVKNSIYKNPYCFRAWDSAGTTLTDATIVQINLGTEIYDYNNNFASNAYTAPVGGLYHFSGAVSISGAVSTGVEMIIFIFVDGSEHTRGSRTGVISDSGLTISTDILLTAGQVVTLRFFQNSAGNEATVQDAKYTWFAGHLVRMT